MKNKARTFEGVMIGWMEEVTKGMPQRKVRGLTIWDFKKLKRVLVKNNVIKLLNE